MLRNLQKITDNESTNKPPFHSIIGKSMSIVKKMIFATLLGLSLEQHCQAGIYDLASRLLDGQWAKSILISAVIGALNKSSCIWGPIELETDDAADHTNSDYIGPIQENEDHIRKWIEETDTFQDICLSHGKILNRTTNPQSSAETSMFYDENSESNESQTSSENLNILNTNSSYNSEQEFLKYRNLFI